MCIKAATRGSPASTLHDAMATATVAIFRNTTPLSCTPPRLGPSAFHACTGRLLGASPCSAARAVSTLQNPRQPLIRRALPSAGPSSPPVLSLAAAAGGISPSGRSSGVTPASGTSRCCDRAPTQFVWSSSRSQAAAVRLPGTLGRAPASSGVMSSAATSSTTTRSTFSSSSGSSSSTTTSASSSSDISDAPGVGEGAAASSLPEAATPLLSGCQAAEADDEIGRALREAAQQRERLTAALAGGGGVMRVVIDCSFLHTVRSPVELRSLAKQIQTSVGHNRRSEAPVCLQVTSWVGELAEYSEGRMGGANWPLVKYSQPTLELYNPGEIVILSPDADLPLTELDEQRVYVVGGIVDKNIIRGVTADFASSHALEARRLPTLEFAEQLGLGRGVSKRPVLNICDVVLALLRFRTNGGDWADALDAAIPRRKRVPQAGAAAPASIPVAAPAATPATAPTAAPATAASASTS